MTVPDLRTIRRREYGIQENSEHDLRLYQISLPSMSDDKASAARGTQEKSQHTIVPETAEDVAEEWPARKNNYPFKKWSPVSMD